MFPGTVQMWPPKFFENGHWPGSYDHENIRFAGICCILRSGCGFCAADFFQLLFVCLQWRAFRLENRARRHGEEEGGKMFDGGSNACILKDIENDSRNPYDDFLSYKK